MADLTIPDVAYVLVVTDGPMVKASTEHLMPQPSMMSLDPARVGNLALLVPRVNVVHSGSMYVVASDANVDAAGALDTGDLGVHEGRVAALRPRARHRAVAGTVVRSA